ncbi:MAG: sigma-70 family RNA polymerase sigma factor [Chloroflexi bacterium]|nr:sigma-70 family RNA polymerase sigma factor [Chloroflexota bacterium]
MDETNLIQRATMGETAAWEPLMLAYQEPVFRFAYLFLGDPDDAEEITQETFLRAYHNLKRFDLTRPLRPWLLSIAANLARNRHRSVGRYLAALTRSFHADPSEPLDVEQHTAHSQDADQLWKAVRQLNSDDQQIIYLRFFLDLTTAESAQALDVAEGTVKSRLNRAVGRLRVIIKNNFPTLSEGYEL